MNESSNEEINKTKNENSFWDCGGGDKYSP